MQSALKLVKSQKPPLSRTAIETRQANAYQIKPDWDKMSTINTVNLIDAHSKAIGAPKEFVFFPLLTAAAAMMGTDSRIRLTPSWTEPPIIWNIVAARKGEKKSAAMRIINEAVREVETELIRQHLTDKMESDNEPVIHMTNSQFTFTKLHQQMRENNGECLLMYDEIAALYDQLDHQSGGSQCERKILLSLYNGDSWSRASKTSGSVSIEKTLFNYTGFIQPTLAIAMLNVDDFDGFIDRHTAIICPQRVKVYMEDLVPVPENTASLGKLLTDIKMAHMDGIEYNFSDEAKAVFQEFYNSLEDQIEEADNDEDKRGILSKAQGQTARLAMVLHSVHAAVNNSQSGSALKLESIIESSSVKCAISVMQYCIQQKFTLMDSNCDVNNPVIPSPIEDNVCITDSQPKKVKLLLEYGVHSMDAAYVAQRKLMPASRLCPTTSNPRPTKYPVSLAKEFLQELEKLGLGDITETEGKRKALVFKKRAFEELSQNALDILRKLNISEEKYRFVKE